MSGVPSPIPSDMLKEIKKEKNINRRSTGSAHTDTEDNSDTTSVTVGITPETSPEVTENNWTLPIDCISPPRTKLEYENTPSAVKRSIVQGEVTLTPLTKENLRKNREAWLEEVSIFTEGDTSIIKHQSVFDASSNAIQKPKNKIDSLMTSCSTQTTPLSKLLQQYLTVTPKKGTERNDQNSWGKMKQISPFNIMSLIGISVLLFIGSLYHGKNSSIQLSKDTVTISSFLNQKGLKSDTEFSFNFDKDHAFQSGRNIAIHLQQKVFLLKSTIMSLKSFSEGVIKLSMQQFEHNVDLQHVQRDTIQNLKNMTLFVNALINQSIISSNQLKTSLTKLTISTSFVSCRSKLSSVAEHINLSGTISRILNDPEFKEDMLQAHEEAEKSLDLTVGLQFARYVYDSSKTFVNKTFREIKKRRDFQRILTAMQAEERNGEVVV